MVNEDMEWHNRHPTKNTTSLYNIGDYHVCLCFDHFSEFPPQFIFCFTVVVDRFSIKMKIFVNDLQKIGIKVV